MKNQTKANDKSSIKATQKPRKKENVSFTMPTKKMTYNEAVKAMIEDSNRTLLNVYTH